MAYRFTDTNKWNDAWFLELKPSEKLLFNYLCDNCDIAGFIEVIPRKWAFDIGETQANILGALEGLRREYYKNNPQAGFFLSMLAKERTGAKNPFYGKKLSKSHIKKMTIARVKAITGENNPSARAVICVETGVRYSLAKDAAASVGLKYSTTILKCCKGIRKKAGGYTWIYG